MSENNINEKCLKCLLKEQCREVYANKVPDCAALNESMIRVFLDESVRRYNVRLGIFVAGIVFFLLSILVFLGMWGLPKYSVYNQALQGKALLAHAQYSREVAVAEAKAKMESAMLLASADTLRAHGVARSNLIIGQSLTDSYLRWFWISELKPGGQVIYVPTEANLPILEAQGRK